MSLPIMLAAGAALLMLVALLVLQRRRSAAAEPDAESAAGKEPSEETAAHHGLGTEQWRGLGTGDRLKAVVRGGRHGLRLLRDPAVAIYRAVDDDAIRVVHEHDAVYGGRPNWAHIAELTRAMGKAERCWPGAELAGVLSYTDRTVPVEYSPRLVADLEDEIAPDPDGATVIGRLPGATGASSRGRHAGRRVRPGGPEHGTGAGGGVPRRTRWRGSRARSGSPRWPAPA